MLEPQISWFIKENDALVPYDDYYAGSYKPLSEISINVQVWNNRWGQTAIENAGNAKLVIYFDTYEDSALLSLCKVSIDSSVYSELIQDGNKGYLYLGTLSGYTNDGIDNSANKSNYYNLELKFGPMPSNLQDGIKNMFLNIEYDA